MNITNFLNRVPLDKSHHYMGGTLVAAVAAIGTMILLATASRALPYALPHGGILAISAIAAVVGAFVAGHLKEHMDAMANADADKAGTPRPHAVEVADWQFTAWGAAPVALPLLVAAVVVAAV